MKIGNKLRMMRVLKGFTQEEVALKLNMERRTYANLENNTTKIDVPRINQIASLYGIEVEEIMNFDENKAFDKCFNKNVEAFFSVEKIKAVTSDEEQKIFLHQIKTLVTSLNHEQRVFLESIVNLKNTIAKTE